MSFDVPTVCTLPATEKPLRQAEFQALFATALRDQERISDRRLRMWLAGGDGLAATVRDLTARETACCSFFGFTVTPTATGVVLDIEVPASHVAVLDNLSSTAADAATAG